MAYRIFGVKPEDLAGQSLLTGMFGCYDTIGDPAFDYDRDETLHERSAYELVRDQLTVDQQTELDKVDAYWQANAKDFNADFAVFHFQENKQTALTGFVMDEDGNVPPIPRAHWWWRPIEEQKA
jgi:hypothetical protein